MEQTTLKRRKSTLFTDLEGRGVRMGTCLPVGGDMRCRFNPWVGKIPWRGSWQPTAVFLPGESHEQWSLAGYGPFGRKEFDMTEATYQ